VVARLHRGQRVGREVAYLERLVVVDARFPADGATRERDADERRLVAARVADLEFGAAVDPDDSLGHDVERGLLPHLAHHRLRRLLPGLHGSAGQAPLAVVAAALEQDVPRLVDDDRRDPGGQQEIVADLGADVVVVAGEGQTRDLGLEA